MSKYKILKDFQLTTDDKKIVILKAKAFIIDYKYVGKDGSVKMDPIVVENNPDYFQFIDFKTDFILFLKTNKIAQPSVVAKKILPYIEEHFKSDNLNQNSNSKEVILLENELAALKLEYNKSIDKLSHLELDFNNTMERNTALKSIDDKKHILRIEALMTEVSSMSADIEALNGVIEQSQQTIKTLEVRLAKSTESNFVNNKEIEEEMLTTINDINKRLEAVMEREDKVRTAELENANHNTKIIEVEYSNQKERKELDQYKVDLESRLSNVLEKEAQLLLIDTQTLIDNAIADYEKGIPWQYHREKK